MPRDIGRKSVFWLAEEVADYLHEQCVLDPNPQYAQALQDIWAYILDPFFTASPACDLTHGPCLEKFVPLSTVIAALGPNNSFRVGIRGVCSAIAYVLSTSQQSFPPSKYLVLAAVFAHFSRMVHTSQRPKFVHFLWATDTQGNSSTSPIILLDDATILTPHSGGVRYRVKTLTDLLTSLHLSTSHNHAASPSCDCSKVIPAIWSINQGGPVTGFSVVFEKLLPTVRQYRKGEIGSVGIKVAARPVCDTCQILMSSSTGMRLAYTDLGVDDLAPTS